jgi:hypothetical protein
MKQNIGKVDRLLRIVIGVVLVAYGIIQGGPWYALAVVGAVFLFTAVTQFCGLYTLLRINTRK